jgi:hypothetical protein
MKKVLSAEGKSYLKLLHVALRCLHLLLKSTPIDSHAIVFGIWSSLKIESKSIQDRNWRSRTNLASASSLVRSLGIADPTKEDSRRLGTSAKKSSTSQRAPGPESRQHRQSPI